MIIENDSITSQEEIALDQDTGLAVIFAALCDIFLPAQLQPRKEG